MLNQVLQAELGFIPLRWDDNFFDRNWKNSSYIWAPDTFYLENPDPIGKFLSIFCPKFFKEVPVGEYAGQDKFWPWFWLICPCFILITPMAFGLAMIFDHKNFVADVKAFSFKRTWVAICTKFSAIKATVCAPIKEPVAESTTADAEYSPQDVTSDEPQE